MMRNRIRHNYADDEVRAKMVDDIIITLGYRYYSQAVLAEERKPVLTAPLQLTGEPGTRAPHLWLDRDGDRISTVDLFHESYVLLIGPTGTAWREAASALASQTAVPLRIVVIGPDGDYTTPGDNWAAAYGVSPQGAVLVRPDAFVAWRSSGTQDDPGQVLGDILGTVAGIARPVLS